MIMSGTAKPTLCSFGTPGDHQLLLVRRQSHQVSLLNPYRNLKSYESLHSRNFLSKNQETFPLKLHKDRHTKSHIKMKTTVYSNLGSSQQPEEEASSDDKKILEILFQILHPLWHCTWTPIAKIMNEFKMVVVTIDTAVHLIIKIAEVVAMVAGELARQFPKGSQPNRVARIIRVVAKRIAKNVGKADIVIHKIEDIDEELDDLLDHGEHVKAVKVKLSEPDIDNQENVEALETKTMEPENVETVEAMGTKLNEPATDDQENLEAMLLKAIEQENVEPNGLETMEPIIHQEDMGGPRK